MLKSLVSAGFREGLRVTVCDVRREGVPKVGGRAAEGCGVNGGHVGVGPKGDCDVIDGSSPRDVTGEFWTSWTFWMDMKEKRVAII